MAPLNEAVSEGLGALVRRKSEIIEAAAEQPSAVRRAIGGITSAWKKGAELAGEAGNYKDGFALLAKAYEKAQPLLELFNSGT